MAEYIDKQSVYKEACAGCTCHGDEIGSCFSSEPCERLCLAFASANAVDVAPVVRCKDCKYSTLPSMQTQIYGKPGTLTCHNRKSPCNNRNVASEDYCKRGEREEE